MSLTWYLNYLVTTLAPGDSSRETEAARCSELTVSGVQTRLWMRFFNDRQDRGVACLGVSQCSTEYIYLDTFDICAVVVGA